MKQLAGAQSTAIANTQLHSGPVVIKMASDRHRDHENEEERRRPNVRRKMTVRPGFSHEKALIFGVIQLMCGLAAIVMGVISIATRAWGYYYGSGFWCGGFFLTAGIFGLAAARRKTNASIISLMVFSSISAMLALVLMALSAVGITSDHMIYKELKLNEGSALVVQSVNIVIALVESVSGTVSAVMGCKAVCGAWYNPDSTYISAAHTPTSSDFGGVRSSYHAQYDPMLYAGDPRCHTEMEGGGPTVVSGAGMDPHQIPFPMPPSSTAQQIAFVSPMGPTTSADGGAYNMPQGALLMQTSSVAGGFNQVMYIMPPAPPCPQPGVVPKDDFRPPGTPPPSYSQLELDRIGNDDELTIEEEHEDGDNGEEHTQNESNSDQTGQLDRSEAAARMDTINISVEDSDDDSDIDMTSGDGIVIMNRSPRRFNPNPPPVPARQTQLASQSIRSHTALATNSPHSRLSHLQAQTSLSNNSGCRSGQGQEQTSHQSRQQLPGSSHPSSSSRTSRSERFGQSSMATVQGQQGMGSRSSQGPPSYSYSPGPWHIQARPAAQPHQQQAASSSTNVAHSQEHRRSPRFTVL